MEDKKNINPQHIIISVISGFILGAYLFGSKESNIKNKIKNEIINYKSNKTIESIKKQELKQIKQSLIGLLEKMISELKKESKDGELKKN